MKTGLYYLTFWGQIENDSLVEKELGITDKDFWFETKKERKAFKSRLREVADKHKVIVVFREEQGEHVKFRTVAKMVIVTPDGVEHEYKYDFGYGFPESTANYMFKDGGYSCDCNRGLFLSIDMPCGDSIKMKDFKIIKENQCS